MNFLRSLHVFVRVAETGSFSAVGRELGLPQPTVSRFVAQLETSLGVKLLLRTTRQVTLTEAGRQLLERGGPLARDLADVAREVREGSQEPVGVVRLAAPASLGRRLLLPTISRFVATYPGVRVDLSLSDRTVDLLEENIDVAVRVGAPGAGTQVTRTLGMSQQWLVASRAYLAKAPRLRSPMDLPAHSFVGRKLGGRLLTEFGPVTLPEARFRVSADDIETVLDATLAGLGVTFLPVWLVRPAVRSKRLVRLLPTAPMPEAKVVAVLPGGRQPPHRVRLLIDTLARDVGAALNRK